MAPLKFLHIYTTLSLKLNTLYFLFAHFLLSLNPHSNLLIMYQTNHHLLISHENNHYIYLLLNATSNTNNPDLILHSLLYQKIPTFLNFYHILYVSKLSVSLLHSIDLLYNNHVHLINTSLLYLIPLFYHLSLHLTEIYYIEILLLVTIIYLMLNLCISYYILIYINYYTKLLFILFVLMNSRTYYYLLIFLSLVSPI